MTQQLAIMEATVLWLSIGLGVWLGASASRLYTFRGCRPTGAIAGALFILWLWPAALFVLAWDGANERAEIEDALRGPQGSGITNLSDRQE